MEIMTLAHKFVLIMKNSILYFKLIIMITILYGTVSMKIMEFFRKVLTR